MSRWLCVSSSCLRHHAQRRVRGHRIMNQTQYLEWSGLSIRMGFFLAEGRIASVSFRPGDRARIIAREASTYRAAVHGRCVAAQVPPSSYLKGLLHEAGVYNQVSLPITVQDDFFADMLVPRPGDTADDVAIHHHAPCCRHEFITPYCKGEIPNSWAAESVENGLNESSPTEESLQAATPWVNLGRTRRWRACAARW